MLPSLSSIRTLLTARQGTRPAFLVPEFLADPASLATRMVDVGDPCRFFIRVIDDITSRTPRPPATGISPGDIVYQGFLRTFCSLNRHIGSALTQLAFLPFLRDRLGVTVFLTLPTGTIGETNRKGTRGSPFAVRNPFEIDPSFADPLLPEVSAARQYQALGEACRALGMRAGSIVPMATLAVDSPLFSAFPEIGFWWQAAPGELVFGSTPGISPAPYLPGRPSIAATSRRRFTAAPEFTEVTRIATATGLHFATADGRLTLANAFPDVLADSAASYTWQDVATVNYGRSVVPAPTGSVVSERAPELTSWALMPAVIAWRYHELGERVQLIDVSPSVPGEVLARARRLAAGWDAGFSSRLARLGNGALDHASAQRLVRDLRAAEEREDTEPVADLTIIGEELWQFDAPGPEVDAVAGPLIFCVSAHAGNRGVFLTSLRHHLNMLAERKGSNCYLAGAANHDTRPPAPADVVLLSALYSFLPGAVPLVFSGSEWGAQQVTNKEFGFDGSPELLGLRGQLGDEQLGLFNDIPLDWDTLADQGKPGTPLVQMLARLHEIRRVVPGMSDWKYQVLRFGDGLTGYARTAPQGNDGHVIAVVNWGASPSELTWAFPRAKLNVIRTDPMSCDELDVGPGSVVTLPPGAALIGLALLKFAVVKGHS